jgi:hypothetical protein
MPISSDLVRSESLNKLSELAAGNRAILASIAHLASSETLTANAESMILRVSEVGCPSEFRTSSREDLRR